MSPSPGRRIVGTQKNPLEGLACNALTIPQAPARRRRIAQAADAPDDEWRGQKGGVAAEKVAVPAGLWAGDEALEFVEPVLDEDQVLKSCGA